MATWFYTVLLHFFSPPPFCLPSFVLNNSVSETNLVTTLLSQVTYEYENIPGHSQQYLWKSTGGFQHTFLLKYFPYHLTNYLHNCQSSSLSCACFVPLKTFQENFEYEIPFLNLSRTMHPMMSFICMPVVSFKRPQHFRKT